MGHRFLLRPILGLRSDIDGRSRDAYWRAAVPGDLAPRPRHATRREGCENCRDRGGWRPVFKIVERGTRNEEMIYPEGDTYAVKKQADELFKKYRGSKTHLFYDCTITPCSCPAGRYVAAEQRRRREQEERRGRR